MVRRSLILVFVVLFTLPIARPQQLIENPAKPPAKNAGRVVSLERLFSIREGPPGEPLRGPYDIQVGDDGSIYFYDNFEFHKFSPNGKFVFKIVRSGQGPGEAQRRTVALAKSDEIVVLANSPRKIMWFDKTGKLLRELRTQDSRRYLYLFAAGGRMYGFREGDPPRGPDVVAGYVDVPTWLDEIEPDSGQPTARMSFPVQNYVVAGGGAWWQSLFLEFATSDGKTLFITHTPEYKVLKYDLVLNKVISAFGRRYARVALPSKKKTPSRPGQLAPPDPKYYLDVSTLLLAGDRLWVVTSTRDAKQNRLIDVYDTDGHYIDNFFLQYPEGISHPRFSRSNIAIRGDRLYSIDEEEDGTVSVSIYRF